MFSGHDSLNGPQGPESDGATLRKMLFGKGLGLIPFDKQMFYVDNKCIKVGAPLSVYYILTEGRCSILNLDKYKMAACDAPGKVILDELQDMFTTFTDKEYEAIEQYLDQFPEVSS